MASAIHRMATLSALRRSISVVGVSFFVGDIVCQLLESREGLSSWRCRQWIWDSHRTTEFAAVGVAVLAPASHALELGLERAFPGANALRIAQKVAARVAVSPLFLSLNFGSLALLRGQDVAEVLSEKVGPAWRAGCLFWPVVAAATYRFVPLLARPAVGAAVGCVWSCYLSWVVHGSRFPAL